MHFLAFPWGAVRFAALPLHFLKRKTNRERERERKRERETERQRETKERTRTRERKKEYTREREREQNRAIICFPQAQAHQHRQHNAVAFMTPLVPWPDLTGHYCPLCAVASAANLAATTSIHQANLELAVRGRVLAGSRSFTDTTSLECQR